MHSPRFAGRTADSKVGHLLCNADKWLFISAAADAANDVNVRHDQSHRFEDAIFL